MQEGKHQNDLEIKKNQEISLFEKDVLPRELEASP
jgi:hypothetical protein